MYARVDLGKPALEKTVSALFASALVTPGDQYAAVPVGHHSTELLAVKN